MERFSISITLGKPSDPHGANLAHNNRDFLASNIRRNRVHDNQIFKQQDVHDAYAELFGAAIAEYNAKQKQPCRRITDYYEHIASGKREEPFYEIIVQLGDSQDTPCGSRRAQIAQKILCEYAATFKARNPNLHIFNCVLHLDEASPHLHIDFIPFYSKDRQRGLRKGVSMRAALKEMGIVPQNGHANQLVAWEERERRQLEYLLRRRGHEREDKRAKHAHLSVDEYKAWQDSKRFTTIFRDRVQGTKSEQEVQSMAVQLAAMTERNAKLEQQMYSPYRSFFYADDDKRAFVEASLDRERIPYRETENGFEAQECYVEQIRAIEKQYTVPPRSLRGKLRDDIDRMLMMSKDFDEFLKRLAEQYEIKRGKYLAVKPEGGTNFIRLKSLGTMYNETALRKRITLKAEYESDLAQKIESARQQPGYSYSVLRVMQNYIVFFSKGYLPVRKKNPKGILCWENDAVLDRLLALNEKLNQGVTLHSLRQEAEQKQQEVIEQKERLQECDAYVQHLEDVMECTNGAFHGHLSARFAPEQTREMRKEFSEIHAGNRCVLEQRLANAKEYRQRTADSLAQAESELRDATDWLTTAEQVLGGSFLQTMVQQEMQRQNAESGAVPNGQTEADAQQEPPRYVPRRR